MSAGGRKHYTARDHDSILCPLERQLFVSSLQVGTSPMSSSFFPMISSCTTITTPYYLVHRFGIFLVEAAT
jgi:hypothetical protein